MSDGTRRYDFTVVGAGSAGAIVATRLSEDPNTQVLLLEAGLEDRSYWSRIPLGFAKILFNPRYMWLNHATDPEPHIKGRSFPLPHGKLVGGSSAINGLVHVRGAPFDYDTWRDMGAEGWGYEDVLMIGEKGTDLLKADHASGRARSAAAGAAPMTRTPNRRPFLAFTGA